MITVLVLHSPACSHGPSNEDRLPGQLVVNRNEGMVGREGSSGALTVDKKGTLLTINHVCTAS